MAGRLFGVTVERADGRAPVWHPDVHFFALAKDGRPKAYFYLDPYSRPAGPPRIASCSSIIIQRDIDVELAPHLLLLAPGSVSSCMHPRSLWLSCGHQSASGV